MANGNWEMGKALISRMSRPARLIVIAILALTLLIPLGMVQSVVHERHQTYRGVISDISGSWSGEQQIAGPMLVVPFTERFEVRDEYVTNGENFNELKECASSSYASLGGVYYGRRNWWLFRRRREFD